MNNKLRIFIGGALIVAGLGFGQVQKANADEPNQYAQEREQAQQFYIENVSVQDLAYIARTRQLIRQEVLEECRDRNCDDSEHVERILRLFDRYLVSYIINDRQWSINVDSIEWRIDMTRRSVMSTAYSIHDGREINFD